MEGQCERLRLLTCRSRHCRSRAWLPTSWIHLAKGVRWRDPPRLGRTWRWFSRRLPAGRRWCQYKALAKKGSKLSTWLDRGQRRDPGERCEGPELEWIHGMREVVAWRVRHPGLRMVLQSEMGDWKHQQDTVRQVSRDHRQGRRHPSNPSTARADEVNESRPCRYIDGYRRHRDEVDGTFKEQGTGNAVGDSSNRQGGQ
jgi:hypothetical protein